MAVNNEENEDAVIYEVDEKGQMVVVRSVSSEQCVYVRFVNRTSRPVDVWWRDFQGKRRHYSRMGPRSFFNVDTFVTHPWEFTDPATHENYLINSKKIFRAPAHLAGMKHRTNWLICVSVRTLRNTALLTLAQYLDHPRMVPELGLPYELGKDLGALIIRVQHPIDPPPRT